MTFRDIHYKQADPSEKDAVTSLLQLVGLPLEGVDEHFHDFLVAHVDGVLIGCAGLEVHGEHVVGGSVSGDHGSVHALRNDQVLQQLPHGLLPGVAVEQLGAVVPTGDDTVEILGDDRIAGRGDD